MCSVELFKPRVNVLWKGKVPGKQAVKTDEPLTLLIPTEGTSLRTMILEGSLQRFRKEIDLYLRPVSNGPECRAGVHSP